MMLAATAPDAADRLPEHIGRRRAVAAADGVRWRDISTHTEATMGDIRIDDPRVELAKTLFLPKTVRAGTVFFLPSGVYTVRKPMVIPAGSSLEGAGTMTFTPGGRP